MKRAKSTCEDAAVCAVVANNKLKKKLWKEMKTFQSTFLKTCVVAQREITLAMKLSDAKLNAGMLFARNISLILFRFKNFLRVFKDPATKKLKYIEAIKEMAANNRESLEVDYDDLAHDTGEQNICYFLPEAPVQVY